MTNASKRHRWLLALVAGFFLAAPPAASGQILQGPHVLELTVRALSGAKTLRIEQEVTVAGGDDAGDPLTLSETLHYVFPARFRSEARHPDSHRIHVAAHGGSLTIVDGHRVADPPGHVDRYKDLLFHRSRHPLHKMLLLDGVDVENTSLGRFEDLVVFVLGAQYPDKSISQVWVDRERFLPVRWLHIPASGPDDRLEFVYRDWGKESGQWYPMQVAVYHRHRLIRRIDVKALQADVDVPDDLFDLSGLISRYPPAPPGESADLPMADVDEVQRVIEEALQNESAE
jgi:hypothetical protein